MKKITAILLALIMVSFVMSAEAANLGSFSNDKVIKKVDKQVDQPSKQAEKVVKSLGAENVKSLKVSEGSLMATFGDEVNSSVVATFRSPDASLLVIDPFNDCISQYMGETREDFMYIGCHCLAPNCIVVSDVMKAREGILCFAQEVLNVYNKRKVDDYVVRLVPLTADDLDEECVKAAAAFVKGKKWFCYRVVVEYLPYAQGGGTVESIVKVSDGKSKFGQTIDQFNDTLDLVKKVEQIVRGNFFK